MKKYRDEVAQLNQEKASLQQELAQATENQKRRKTDGEFESFVCHLSSLPQFAITNTEYEDQENLPMTPPVLPIRQSSLEVWYVIVMQ